MPGLEVWGEEVTNQQRVLNVWEAKQTEGLRLRGAVNGPRLFPCRSVPWKKSVLGSRSLKSDIRQVVLPVNQDGLYSHGLTDAEGASLHLR